MKTLKFNKVLTSQRQGNEPSVIFRKLADTGNNNRYQGSINNSGASMIKELMPLCNSLQVVFSDKHSAIGFKPLNDKTGCKWVFGATQLFKSINLVTGKKYKLEINGEYAVINSEEHNK